ncbi:MAG: Crp/Fnr family transcriptional regulator [Sulfuricella sp.]|nr:Crp/Fnr family transcriptional regulator [Sulfuricella sp.]
MSLPNQYLEEMRQIYLFERLDDAQFGQAMDHARMIQLTAGDMLFAEGDPCHHFFVVIRGMVKLFKSSADGSEKILELIPPKQLFGEEAMFLGQHSAYAEALEPTQLIAFDCHYFAGLLRENAELCLRMMTLMSHRSKSLLDEIGNLTLQSGIQRVVQYLMEAGNYSGIACTVRLNLPKNVIASRLGVKPETFSRIIAKLRNEGMIDCTKDTIRLKNVDSLRQVADGMLWLKVA